MVRVSRHERQNGKPSLTDQLQPIKSRLAHGTTVRARTISIDPGSKLTGVPQWLQGLCSKTILWRQWGQFCCFMATSYTETAMRTGGITAAKYRLSQPPQSRFNRAAEQEQ
jgi:hypothetical protein